MFVDFPRAFDSIHRGRMEHIFLVYSRPKETVTTIMMHNKNTKTMVSSQLIDPVGRVFASGPRDLGSIPGRVIPKTLKMVLDTSLLNTQQYKVHTKGKVEQSRERSSTLPYTSVE